ncbi:hypothetical protein [Sorangium sp. So ce1000]
MRHDEADKDDEGDEDEHAHDEDTRATTPTTDRASHATPAHLPRRGAAYT